MSAYRRQALSCGDILRGSQLRDVLLDVELRCVKFFRRDIVRPIVRRLAVARAETLEGPGLRLREIFASAVLAALATDRDRVSRSPRGY